MPCTNCGKRIAAAPPGRARTSAFARFGRCPRCFFLSLLGLVVSMLAIVPLLAIDLPARYGWTRVVPVALFALWFTLHLAGYSVRRWHQRRSGTAAATRTN